MNTSRGRALLAILLTFGLLAAALQRRRQLDDGRRTPGTGRTRAGALTRDHSFR